MEQKKIDRINELARKAKTVGLTPDEIEERDKLRKEYIEAYRASLRSQLESIRVVDEKGNKRPLKKKDLN
ncbi:MAG: DUF896 domain-containing protein [Clostridia bacterium]|nr:DUF896 domain-containing protein [Clostridia bacterium]